MGIKIVLILTLILVLSPCLVCAEDGYLLEKIGQDTQTIFSSFESIQHSSNRQKEICKYKTIFENLAVENIQGETATYDAEGRLAVLKFSDNSKASYTYFYNSDEKLETVLIKYGDIEFALFTQTNEFFLSFRGNENEQDEEPTVPHNTENPDNAKNPQDEPNTNTDNPEKPIEPEEDNKPDENNNQVSENNKTSEDPEKPTELTEDTQDGDKIFSESDLKDYEIDSNALSVQYAQLCGFELKGLNVTGRFTNNSNPKNLRLNLPALREEFMALKNASNAISSELNKNREAYYSALYSKLKENLGFWLENLNLFNLEGKIKNNILNEKECRLLIGEALRNADQKAEISEEYMAFLTLEKTLKIKLLSDVNNATAEFNKLISQFYRNIEEILQNQDIPLIVESDTEINIIISLPNLEIETQKGKYEKE